MKVIERTAMRVVVEQSAPRLAPATAAAAALVALAAAALLLLTKEPLYLLAVAAAIAIMTAALWMTHGVRTTLDATENVARWERTGVLPARREARLSEVGAIVLRPHSDDERSAVSPVLTVGSKRWPLALSSVTDVEAARAAIAEVLDLAKGRRTL